MDLSYTYADLYALASLLIVAIYGHVASSSMTVLTMYLCVLLSGGGPEIAPGVVLVHMLSSLFKRVK